MPATASSHPNRKSIAVRENHRSWMLSSLPGAQSRLTAKSSITLDHSTAPRRSPRASNQNLSRPNSSHNRHPSQQSPNIRGRRTERLESTTSQTSSSCCGARPSRSLKSRRWQTRPSSSITSMERCQRSICVVLSSPRFSSRRCTTRSRPTRVVSAR